MHEKHVDESVTKNSHCLSVIVRIPHVVCRVPVSLAIAFACSQCHGTVSYWTVCQRT